MLHSYVNHFLTARKLPYARVRYCVLGLAKDVLVQDPESPSLRRLHTCADI